MTAYPDKRTGNGPAQFNAGAMPEIIANLAVGPTTLTDQAAALGYYNQDNGFIFLLDLAGMLQVRLTARVKTASASAASPRLRLAYNTTLQTTAASTVQLGRTAAVDASIFTGVTMADSGWLDLADGAKINNCYVALLMVGGDAAADPIIGPVTAHFR
jgi:hypothetical protein